MIISRKQRLLSIIVFFTIIGFVLLWALLNTQNMPIKFAKKELEGNIYQSALEKVLQGFIQHKIVVQRTFFGKSGKSQQEETFYLRNIQLSVDNDLNELNKTHNELGEKLQLTESGLKRRNREHYQPEIMQKEWVDLKNKLKTKTSSLNLNENLKESNELHSHLISDVRQMIIHLGNTSNLILDPNLDSYYLMDITLIKLPQIQERIQEVLSEVEKIIYKNKLNLQDEMKARVFASMMRESDIKRIKIDLETALNENKEINLLPAQIEFINSYSEMTTFVEDVSNGKIPNLEKFTKVSEEALNKSFNYWKLAVGELNKTLKKRIDSLQSAKYKATGISYFLLFIIFITALFIAKRIISCMDELMEDLIQKSKIADDANKAKTEFLANISHEIRTPLAVIIGFSELIQTQSLIQPLNNLILMGHISKIKKSGQHILEVVNEMLDLSKVEAGKMVVKKTSFPLESLFHELLLTTETLRASKNLKMTFKIEDSVPKQIFSDETKLRQILLNLINNSIKFSDHGEISIVASLKNSEKLSFLIKDEGRGISPEDTKKLFKPYEQIDPLVKCEYKGIETGTGLGLALSRKLAQILGGDLFLVSSEIGKGTSFGFIIDIKNDSTKNEISDLNKKKEARLDNLRILLVEDSEDHQQMISSFLKSAGATVEIAANGRLGVEKALTGSFDAILMDILMPEMNGYQAISNLRDKGIKTPILALTAYGTDREKNICLGEKGFDDFLTKPISQKDLAQHIYETLHNHFGKNNISRNSVADFKN